MTPPIAPVELCDDDALGYRRSRTAFAPGAGLALDEAYRHAHLPLVAPGHPDVIATRSGSAHVDGRHPPVFSLVLMVDAAALRGSPAYQALERALRDSPLAGKIAWDVLDRRWDRVHATLCGHLGIGAPPALAPLRAALRDTGPFAVELRGLFSGDVNRGRLYLRVYPERRGGANVVQAIQRRLGRRETDLYLVGLFNLVDHLDAAEAAALDALLAAWWDRPLLRFTVERLRLLGATDDLVLEPPTAVDLPLTAGATPGA
ncbi:MAG: hypothetical protein JNK67_31775 [Alphaproteobacteria bacterium]|nr:hypothetical protein [Alphaproteobacteria bacterium]